MRFSAPSFILVYLYLNFRYNSAAGTIVIEIIFSSTRRQVLRPFPPFLRRTAMVSNDNQTHGSCAD
jgi:hypothetical protein